MRRWGTLLARRSARARRLVLAARFGDLARTDPLTEWGYGRGRPVDRYYIDGYLHDHRHLVSGHVLEVKEDYYGSLLGGSSVDVVDIDDSNVEATIVGDLCDPRTLAGVRADSVILTQTLQYLEDPHAALGHVLDCMQPGATLLVTVPCAQRVDGGHDLWRWTPPGLERQLRAALGDRAARLDVAALGNGLSLRASVFGLAAEDLDDAALAGSDPSLPLVAAASVTLSC